MAKVPFRPPWALEEALFTSLCSRCDQCLAACPTGLLVKGSGGFPEADFQQGHCTFCGDCRTACQTVALQKSPDISPWPIVARIGDECLARQKVVCRTCGERCEAGAIAFGPQLGGVPLPRLDTERCTGCGECVADCPTRAIAMLRPAQPSPQGANP